MKSGRENGSKNLCKDGKVLLWIIRRVIWMQVRYFGIEIFVGAAIIYEAELCDTSGKKVIRAKVVKELRGQHIC